jgi:hypothetical protein
MLRAAASYYRQEVKPRRRELLGGSELVMATGIAVFFVMWGPGLAIASTKLGDLLTVVMAYAAVAFGFCLAGLTVALTLPDREFTTLLATKEPTSKRLRKKQRPANAYSDLLFVFSWTAVAHWLVIVVSLVLLVACGFDAKLIEAPASLAARLRGGVLSFTMAYAVVQFLVTLITLSQVGNRYVDGIKKRSPAAE